MPLLTSIHNWKPQVCFFKFFFVFVLLAHIGCERAASVKETVANFAADLVPTSAVETLDQQAWAQMKSTLKVVDSPEVQSAMGFLVTPLIKAAEAKGTPVYQWDFHIVQSPDLNAFALPGGTIAVNAGLLEFSDSGVEVIGILAHEVAHVAAKHGVKSMLLQTGVSFLSSLVIGSFFGDIGGLSDLAIGGITKLGLLKYSRDNERQADLLGAELLQQAGYPISGLSRFFAEVETQKGQSKQPGGLVEKSLSLLSTHPMSVERAQVLEKLALQQTVHTLGTEQAKKYNVLRQLVTTSKK